MASFGAEVTALSERYQRRMRALARTAAQETVSIAQRIEDEGGRMRVKTGFLRASIAASTGSMPSGVSVNPDPNAESEIFQYEGTTISAALLKWQPWDTLYVGWVANYARPREARDGFLRGAVEQWDQTVKIHTARIRQRI